MAYPVNLRTLKHPILTPAKNRSRRGSLSTRAPVDLTRTTSALSIMSMSRSRHRRSRRSPTASSSIRKTPQKRLSCCASARRRWRSCFRYTDTTRACSCATKSAAAVDDESLQYVGGVHGLVGHGRAKQNSTAPRQATHRQW